MEQCGREPGSEREGYDRSNQKVRRGRDGGDFESGKTGQDGAFYDIKTPSGASGGL